MQGTLATTVLPGRFVGGIINTNTLDGRLHCGLYV